MSVTLTPEAPEQFRAFVMERYGLRFEDGKLGFLSDLLRRRAEARGTSVERYLAHVAADSAEDSVLAEELTVGETYFFRNSDQFAALREKVFPERMRGRESTRRLAVLSAGCSTGEEPFSIAMLSRALLPPPWQISIRAADLNPAALRKARSGRYSSWSLRETPPDMLSAWFHGHGRDVEVDESLRTAVQFERCNLTDPHAPIWQPEAYDVVFCRNVIMYFTQPVQEMVIDRIAQSLVPGGYLFLGHAETLRGLSHAFHLVHTHGTFYYQRRGEGDAQRAGNGIDFSGDALRADSPAPWPPAPAAASDTAWYDAIGDASRRIERLARGQERLAPAPRPALKPDPAPAANLSVALDLLRHERFDDALELLGRLPEATVADPDVLLLRALLLAQGGKFAAAGEVCGALLAQDEFNAGANYVLGLCFEGSGDDARAVLRYDLASHLDPQFAMPLLRRGSLARRSGNLEGARADLTHALELLKLEDASRLLLFGGGFTRAALSKLCESELRACEAGS